jgi:hypothetical protein
MPVPGQGHNDFHSYSSFSLFIFCLFLNDGFLPFHCTSTSEWIQYLQIWETASLILFHSQCKSLAQELMVITKFLNTLPGALETFKLSDAKVYPKLMS